MSYLDYSDSTSNNLILQSTIAPPAKHHPPSSVKVDKPVNKESFVEGLDIDSTSGDDVSAAKTLYTDLIKTKQDLDKYNDKYGAMMDTKGRVYSHNPMFDEKNPVNDPISHEYIPRINEAALADIQSRLDFQNRVYAYTAVGLISVVIAGIMFNSNR
jgi:hypothetical protein